MGGYLILIFNFKIEIDIKAMETLGKKTKQIWLCCSLVGEKPGWAARDMNCLCLKVSRENKFIVFPSCHQGMFHGMKSLSSFYGFTKPQKLSYVSKAVYSP